MSMLKEGPKGTLGLLERYGSGKTSPTKAEKPTGLQTLHLSQNKLPSRKFMRIGNPVSERKFPNSDKAFLHYVDQALAARRVGHITQESPTNSGEQSSLPPVVEHSPKEIFHNTIRELKSTLNTNPFEGDMLEVVVKYLEPRYHNSDLLKGKLSVADRDKIGNIMGKFPALSMATETFLKAVDNFTGNSYIIENLPQDYVDFWYSLRGLVSYHILKEVLPRTQEDTSKISATLLQRGSGNMVVESLSRQELPSHQTIFSPELMRQVGESLLPDLQNVPVRKSVKEELKIQLNGGKNVSGIEIQNDNKDANSEWMEQLGFTA
jgi:hypothetical protein